MMDFLEGLGSRIWSFTPAIMVAVLVLGVTYVLIVLVALFHSDSVRRADARKILRLHFFTRKKS